MTIPEHARKNFQPDPNDDKQTAIRKKYYLDKDKTDREILEREQQQEENSDNIKDFKNELKKIKGKTPIEELERAYFINELLNK